MLVAMMTYPATSDMRTELTGVLGVSIIGSCETFGDVEPDAIERAVVSTVYYAHQDGTDYVGLGFDANGEPVDIDAGAAPVIIGIAERRA